MGLPTTTSTQRGNKICTGKLIWAMGVHYLTSGAKRDACDAKRCANAADPTAKNVMSVATANSRFANEKTGCKIPRPSRCLLFLHLRQRKQAPETKYLASAPAILFGSPLLIGLKTINENFRDMSKIQHSERQVQSAWPTATQVGRWTTLSRSIPI